MSAPDLRCVDLSYLADSLYADNPIDSSDYRCALERAVKAGATYQGRRRDGGHGWITIVPPLGPWGAADWTVGWQHYLYRLDPASRPRRPWSRPEDVPGSMVWIRAAHQPDQHLVLQIDERGVSVLSTGYHYHDYAFLSHIAWSGLATGWEHSTDRRTWLPCTLL